MSFQPVRPEYGMPQDRCLRPVRSGAYYYYFITKLLFPHSMLRIIYTELSEI